MNYQTQAERKKFYNSKRWQQKRNAVLRRDKYKCRECARFLIVSKAEHVHHIVAIEDNPELRLKGDNLISLCNVCHGKIENNWRK